MNLVKIEFLKLKNYRTFWVIICLYLVLVPLTFIGISYIEFPFFPDRSEIYSFPKIWNYITYMASWWNLLMGVLVVLITCNEITYKTQRQNVIDGLSKRDIIIGKFLTFLLLAVFAALYTFLLGLIFGIINDGMGDIASGISYIGIYLLQTIGYFSFAFLFAVLVKRPALAIIFYILIFMFRFIIGLIVGDYAAQFFPINVFGDLTPFPFFEQLFELAARSDPNFEEPVILSQSVRSFLAFTWISIFVMISYLVTKRRDI